MMKILIVLFSILFFRALISQDAKTVRISDVVFIGEFALKKSELKKAAGLNEKQLLSSESAASAAKRLEDYLLKKGFLFAKIDSLTIRADDSLNTARIIIFGKSGKRVYFGRISIVSDSLNSDLYYRQLDVRPGQEYSESAIHSEVIQMVKTAANLGYPFAEVCIDSLASHSEKGNISIDIQLQVHEHEKTYIGNIILKGNEYTRDLVILREIGVRPGMVYSRKAVDAIPQQLNRLGFIKNVNEPALIATASDSVHLVLFVEEGNSTSFDGIVGYIPQSRAGGKGYFTGLIDLSFKNLLGTGRWFDVHWKKADRYSEEFLLSYNEPWIFDYPLDIGFILERVVRDTTYLEWDVALNSRLRIANQFSLFANFKRKLVLPDSTASRDLRLVQNSILSGEAGIEYDTRDSPVNPRSGIYYQSSYSFGFKTNMGPFYLLHEDSILQKENLQSIRLKFNWYYSLWSNQVAAVELDAQQVKGDRLQLSDYYWFGGSRSLRGYRENQFRGDIIGWVNLEYRFILGRDSRAFIFNDWGFYRYSQNQKKRQDTLPGYGLGVRFDTPLGLLGVDYGLGRGDSFSQGKIHFGIINRF